MGKKPMVAPYSGAMLAIVAAVNDWQGGSAWPVKLYKLTDNFGFPEHLSDSQSQNRWQ
jgi:hypothetical protein